MPGYHVSIVCYSFEEGHLLYVSRLPQQYNIWKSSAPLFGFVDLPADTYVQVGTWNGSIDEVNQLCMDKANVTIARVYGNYEGGLDLHIDAGHETICYDLIMPSIPIGVLETPYPQPTHWWIAISKKYHYRFPIVDDEQTIEADVEYVYDDLLAMVGVSINQKRLYRGLSSSGYDYGHFRYGGLVLWLIAYWLHASLGLVQCDYFVCVA